MKTLDLSNPEHVSRSVNSYLGAMSHAASYNLRRDTFMGSEVNNVVEFDTEFLRSKPRTALCA